MQTLNTDIQSLGGTSGGLGGLGGGTNPLLWLITLAFLGGDRGLLGGRGGDAGAGVLAGETQAKLDCLSQGQNTLAAQIAKNDTDQNFFQLGAAIDSLAAIGRDGQAASAQRDNDLARQLADCCCDIKTGQQTIQTAIAMQTNELVTQGNANTQRIVDLINQNTLAAKDQRISELEQNAQTATLAAIVRNACGSSGNNGNNGNSLDINALANALQAQSKTAA